MVARMHKYPVFIIPFTSRLNFFDAVLDDHGNFSSM